MTSFTKLATEIDDINTDLEIKKKILSSIKSSNGITKDFIISSTEGFDSMLDDLDLSIEEFTVYPVKTHKDKIEVYMETNISYYEDSIYQKSRLLADKIKDSNLLELYYNVKKEFEYIHSIAKKLNFNEDDVRKLIEGQGRRVYINNIFTSVTAIPIKSNTYMGILYELKEDIITENIDDDHYDMISLFSILNIILRDQPLPPNIRIIENDKMLTGELIDIMLLRHHFELFLHNVMEEIKEFRLLSVSITDNYNTTKDPLLKFEKLDNLVNMLTVLKYNLKHISYVTQIL